MADEKYTDNQYPLILSKRVLNILKNINDEISNSLIEMFKNKKMVRDTFIDITEKDDTVSFISSDKVIKMIDEKQFEKSEIWSNYQRVEIKIGRFVYKLLGERYKLSDIENFVNDYKAFLNSKKLNKNFKLFEGDNIKEWYSEKNYVPGGTLSNSCMRRESAQQFFKIYTSNPTKVKLLVLFDETKKKVLGRALVWFLDNPSGKIFMDRVYFSSDFILNMFINFAIKNKWLYKLDNMDNPMKMVYNNKIIRLTMSVDIKKINYEYFPFVDNICFYDPILGVLTNDPKYLKQLGSNEYYDLCDHLGDYEIRKDFEY